jgi:hypothetical protein
MNEEFHVCWKGQTLGPFTRQEIERQLLSGEITLLHAIRCDGELVDSSKWLHSLRALKTPAAPSIPLPPQPPPPGPKVSEAPQVTHFSPPYAPPPQAQPGDPMGQTPDTASPPWLPPPPPIPPNAQSNFRQNNIQIHITSNGQKHGPYSIDKINSLIVTGQLSPSNTLAWYEGCQDWIRLEDFPGVRVATTAQPPPPPPSGAIPHSATDLAAPKPQKIKTAVLMLWVSVGLGFVRSAWEISAQAERSSVGFVVFIMVFTFGFIGFFIWMIDKGKNWARITFLVLFILGVPLSILPLLASLAHAPISGLLGIVQAILQTIAVIFIFSKDSSAWFKLQKKSN